MNKNDINNLLGANYLSSPLQNLLFSLLFISVLLPTHFAGKGIQ